MSHILVGILFFILSMGATESISAQTSDASLKTQELVAALGKTKYKKKEKKDVVIEIYIEIKNEAVVKKDVSEYAGNYVCETGEYNLDLRVSADGRVDGNGTDAYFEGLNFDKEKAKKFTLQNAKIEGALLTATKVYENGATKKLEAVFVNRTTLNGKNVNEIYTRDTKYGLGFIETNGEFTNRVFLELEP